MHGLTDWTVVIPVKGTPDAKSRLGASAEMAMAIALDTVEAALMVAPVIVVTSGGAAPAFATLRATVVNDAGGGLNAAIRTGIAAAGDGPVAVLLGDLPALRSQELTDALEAAGRLPLAMVADAEGLGTVLIAARAASAHHPSFGEGSRALHAAAGYVELPVAADSFLRRDVDTAEQLRSIPVDRLGARTRLALDRAALDRAALAESV